MKGVNMMKQKTISLILGLLMISMPAAAETQDLSKGINTISPEKVYSYVKTMAAPKYAGRFTGHEGYTAAAEWAAGLFRKWGLKPVEGGYLQPFPSPFTHIKSAQMTLLMEGDEQTSQELEAEADFLPMLASDSGDRTAEAVFAGWGIHAPELGYDDYHAVDVSGKFVLCFRGTPDRSDDRFQKHDEHRHRMQTAKDMGAAGLIYIYPGPLANPNMDWIQDFMPALISENVFDKILKERGTTSDALRKDLLTYKRPVSFPLHSKIRFKVQSEHFPGAEGYNVAGYLEGSDPQLKNECLVFGAHFDHCGEHMGMLFPGANDNASGSAVVMELARAFSQMKPKPRRSVMFVLFGAEEKGLQGSSYFVDHIPGPVTQIDGMFNFDMVGEGDGVGCALSPEPDSMETLLKQSDEHVGILQRIRYLRGVGVRGSDYAPFYQKGIPCISFASNGPHLAYHKTGDTIYRVNPDIMADIARLAFIAGYSWADR